MNPHDVWELIYSLRWRVERHNYLYYILDKPEVSDAEYDELKGKLKLLEASVLVSIPDTFVSPIQRVGCLFHSLTSPEAKEAYLKHYCVPAFTGGDK